MTMDVWMKSDGTFLFDGEQTGSLTVKDLWGFEVGAFNGKLTVAISKTLSDNISEKKFSASATGSLSLLDIGLFEYVLFGIDGDGGFEYNGVTYKFP